MSIIPTAKLPLTAGTDFDFGGGDITSHGGVLLLNELCVALGVPEALRANLREHALREFDDCDVALQQALMLACGMRRDKDAGRLAEDPAFAHVLGSVASQPTVSRRLSRMDMGDVDRLGAAIDEARARVAEAAPARDHVVVDVDSTLTPTFGRKQEGSAFNYHYKECGYHPLIATDTLRREVIGFQLRGGAEYCSKGSGEFLRGVLAALMEREPGARVAVRGDSGFAAPEVYEACEEAGATYVVRLKENRVLLREAYRLVDDHFVPGVARTVTGEFMYRAGSWDRKRRVLFEAAQHDGQIFPDYTFVVTNSEARQAQGFEFYRGRGTMEQIVGEVKELARGCVCSKSMEANAFRCQLAVLAHCLLSWLRLLCLEGGHASAEPRTLLMDFVRVAARRVAHGRRVCFHFSSAYGWQEEFFRAVVACDRVARALRAA